LIKLKLESQLNILKEKAMAAKLEEEKVKGKGEEIKTLELWIRNLTILKKNYKTKRKKGRGERELEVGSFLGRIHGCQDRRSHLLMLC